VFHAHPHAPRSPLETGPLPPPSRRSRALRVRGFVLAASEKRCSRAAEHAFEAGTVERQRRATEKLRLLADSGSVLAQSLDVEATLSALARLAVQWFAEICVVNAIDGETVLGDVVAGADPLVEAAAVRVIGGYEKFGLVRFGTKRPEVWRSPAWLAPTLEGFGPLLLSNVTDDTLRALAIDAAQLEEYRRIGLSSMIVAPLVARGVPIGVVTFARRGARVYDADDVVLAEELARRAALAIDNARLLERANAAVAVRDEFLSVAGHELNTPLTGLKLLLAAASRPRVPREQEAAKLEAATRQVDRLSRLVTQLLDVSRIGDGRVRIEKGPCDLAPLVDDVIAGLADDAHRAGSEIRERLSRPCSGSWDRLRIEQIVSNLLSNAIKYGAGKPISVELDSLEDRVRLVVRDRGIGIECESQRRIFERFERAASARHYGGFGLGLWITRQVVEAHGGSITVESAPGQGSTFSVYLPRR
jgi:signal transduction histidine kinase